MQRIVVGIDGSAESLAALAWAIREARLRNARLDVVHAWSYPVGTYIDGLTPVPSFGRAQIIDIATQVLNDACKGFDASGVELHRIVEEGTAAGRLLETAHGATMLVVGSRGRGGFTGLLLGSVSQQCAHHAYGPVVIIRDARIAPEGERLGRIMVGVDGSEGAAAALRWALDESAHREGSVVVAVMAWGTLDQHHADGDEIEAHYGPKQALDALRSFVEQAVGVDDARKVDLEPVNDSPAPGLIGAAIGADLLVVGARGIGGFRSLLLGSVSQQCSHHAPCPIAIVRTDPADAHRD